MSIFAVPPSQNDREENFLINEREKKKLRSLFENRDPKKGQKFIIQLSPMACFQHYELHKFFFIASRSTLIGHNLGMN